MNLRHEEWTHTRDDGTVVYSFLEEAEPGICHVTTELMEQMMRQLGWIPSAEAGDSDESG